MSELYEGVPVTIRGKDYIVPALSFGQVEKLTPTIERLDKKESDSLTAETMKDMLEVIHAAMSRNYPDLDIEKLKDMIDVRNGAQIIQAVMGGSGFASSNPGEQTPVA